MSRQLALGVQMGQRICAVGCWPDVPGSVCDTLDLRGSRDNGRLRLVDSAVPTTEDGQVLTGEAAVRRCLAPSPQAYRVSSPLHMLLQAGPTGPGVRGWSPHALASAVLGQVLDDALSAWPGWSLAALGLAVPSMASTQQVRWIMEALSASITNRTTQVHPLPEPAAALLGHGDPGAASATILVCDWGWTALRVTLLRTRPPTSARPASLTVVGQRVLAEAAGAAFHDHLCALVTAQVEQEHGAALAALPESSLSRFWHDLEWRLAAVTTAGELALPALSVDPFPIASTLLRAVVAPVVGTLAEVVADLLREQRITTASVNDVLFVGGYARLAYEAGAVPFSHPPLSTVARYPHDAVARGAATYAAGLAGLAGQRRWSIVDAASEGELYG